MASDFRIATFNLESLDDGPDAPDFAARAAILRSQLLRLEADILCLQEVHGQAEPGGGPRRLRALDRLLAGTPYAGFHRVATTGRDGTGPIDVHNLVTLSRFPVVASAQIHHQLVPPPLHRTATAEPSAGTASAVAWDRPLLHVEIALDGGRPLHVVNLHLRAPLAAFLPGQKESAFVWKTAGGWAEGFFLAAVKRAGQALEARLLLERLFDADPEALVAVCGDLNADLREMPTRILCADPSDTGNPALAGRALAPVEGPAGPKDRYSLVHAGRRSMLDHLLVSRGLAQFCRHASVHNEALRDETVADAGAAGSFHAPVVARFVLPGPQSSER